MKPTAGIYVHVPFCLRKCEYCDFYSIVVSNRPQFRALVDSYLSAVRSEARHYAHWVGEYEFDTLFFGGGTPTLVPVRDLAELIAFLRETFKLPPNAEISVEANPKTISTETLRILGEAGVNRISLGAQAFQDSLLTVLGRTHTAAAISESVAALKEAGFSNFSLDLMFGLPGQTMDDWRDTLEKAVALEPTHLSCYSLILEEGTPFHALYVKGELKLPGDDVEREMLEFAVEYLTQHGYIHYEVSNFCLPGFECQHNLHYWHNNPYLGLGPAAAGRLGDVRYSNRSDLNSYISSWQRGEPDISFSETIHRDLAMDETLICGLRLLDGISDADFAARFGHALGEIYPEQIRKLEERGLVQYQAGRLMMTQAGLFLGNLVFAEFLRN